MATQKNHDLRIVRAACPHDCPDTCAMLVTVQDGRAIKVGGDPAHPVTQGFLCSKVSRYVERTYHADRLLYPKRRAGPRGSGRWQRIGWDEALDEIAARFRAIADQHGPEAILPYSYAGTMGLLMYGSMDRRFFNRLGASLLDRTICAEAGATGYKYTIGASRGTDPERFVDARLQGITLEALREHGWLRLNLPDRWAPFAEGNFPTPSGKCELYSERMARDGFDPLPVYTPPAESAEVDPELAARYPLALLSPPAHHFLNSSFVNVLRRFEGEPSLEINPRDADERRIVDGELVRVFNDRGEFRVKAAVTDRVRPGLVLAPSIWWRSLTPDGKGVNHTTSQRLTDMGGGATFYDNLVQVESAK